MVMAETIIDIKHANIYQGDNMVLEDVNLTVKKGEFVYLVGKNRHRKVELAENLIRRTAAETGRGDRSWL